jgi:hypothetical protein
MYPKFMQRRWSPSYEDEGDISNSHVRERQVAEGVMTNEEDGFVKGYEEAFFDEMFDENMDDLL